MVSLKEAKKILIFKLFILKCFDILLSQPMPKNSFNYRYRIIKYDLAQDWEKNSIIRSFRVWDSNGRKSENSFYYEGFVGLNEKNQNISFFGNYTSKKNFFIYATLHSPFSSNINNEELKDFKLKRINQSGLGYQNDWFLFQLGKGNQNWGAGNDISLALNNHSNSYDYFMIYSNYGNLRVNYIHGFLERRMSINRYINARGLEWTNNKSFSLGLSETIIYSGDNRSMDLGYLNPIASHLEVELNNRLNVSGSGSANAVWQIHGDVKLFKYSKLSFNLLVDEFVIDTKIENQKNKEQSRAYSFKYNLPILYSKKNIVYFCFSSVYVGTSTLRHNSGFNNFVHSNKPLGWEFGSDGTENKVELNYYNNKNLIGMVSFSKVAIGEESINERFYEPYKDNLKGAFPSGEVETNYFIKGHCMKKLSKKGYLFLSSVLQFSKNKKRVLRFVLGYNFTK